MKQHQLKYIDVPRETFNRVHELIKSHKEKLDSYIEQLFWWNNRINLVSRSVPRETIMKHIEHSLLLTQLSAYKSSDYVVDTGTGGGLPGIPLAMTSKDKRFMLNDIANKKTLVLKQIVRKSGLSEVEVRGGSVSQLQIESPFLLISKHAFKISDLIGFTKNLPWSAMVFYKGINFEDEIRDIDMRLNINVYDLYTNSNEKFYEGKCIISIVKC